MVLICFDFNVNNIDDAGVGTDYLLLIAGRESWGVRRRGRGTDESG